MAITGTLVINDVLSRMRDSSAYLAATVTPPTTASGRSFILNLINHCAIFLNLAERFLVLGSDLYLSNDVSIYELDLSVASDYGGRILSCNVAGVGEIDGPVDFKAFGRTNRSWVSATNASLTKPLAWAPIGCTLLAFYPILSGDTPVVHIRYLGAPPFTATENQTFAVPDYAAGHLARLTSLVASIKMQQLTKFQERFQALLKDMQTRAGTVTIGGKAD